MSNLITRLGKSITGIIHGFDRIVFKGYLRRLMYPEGAESFLRKQGVLNKDFKSWAIHQTKQVVADLERLAQQQTQRGISPIASSDEEKEKIARKQQQKSGVEQGMIGAWSCVEAGQSFRAQFSSKQAYPELVWKQLRCKHLYVYLAHTDHGFMHLRLQTWFPYQIQICMNGREWLARQLKHAGIGFVLQGNKFLHIDHPDRAQEFLNRQLDSQWPQLLDRLVPMIFPGRE